MIPVIPSILVACAVMSIGLPASSAQPQSSPSSNPADSARPRGRDGQPGGGGRGREGGRGLLSEMNTFKTDVPAHSRNIILVRPTHDSMTVSVVSNGGEVGYVEWAKAPSAGSPADVTEFPQRSKAETLKPGEPLNVVLEGLSSGNRYAYRWRSKAVGSSAEAPFEIDTTRFFVTPPPIGGGATGSRTFNFSIIADSHLDPAMTPLVYEQALLDALKGGAAFHVDLGDTFMTDKRGRDFQGAFPQYVAQRYYFGRLCHSAPLFMVLGNHDGEAGYAARGEGNIAAWSYGNRTRLFPPPVIETGPGAMYTGRTSMKDGAGAHYYEFTWGDAKIIVLDPFWFTVDRPRGGGGGGRGGTQDADVVNTDDNWSRTLGKEQYDWLTRTLETSTAAYKFVFIHHLVGGLGRAVRGGMESSVYFEWGGQNADGSSGFAARRPGWAMPIHDLLVKHHVAAVFHGHDHLYVHAERDGLIYQCVPQPGNLRGNTRAAEMYGYKAGTILGSPGYLRVSVTPEKATVAFVRSALPEGQAEEGGRGGRGGRDGREAAREANGDIVRSYDIKPAKAGPTSGKEAH